jgi:hypothetical protein
MNNDKAIGQVLCMMDPAIQIRFPNYTEPKFFWEVTMTEFKKVIKLNGDYKAAKLGTCHLKSYMTVAEWQSAQNSIIRDLITCKLRSLNHGESAISLRISPIPRSGPMSFQLFNYLERPRLEQKLSPLS